MLRQLSTEMINNRLKNPIPAASRLRRQNNKMAQYPRYRISSRMNAFTCSIPCQRLATDNRLAVPGTTKNRGSEAQLSRHPNIGAQLRTMVGGKASGYPSC